MVNPLVEREGARELTGRIVPIYPLTEPEDPYGECYLMEA